MTQGDFINFILAVFISGITIGRWYSSPYNLSIWASLKGKLGGNTFPILVNLSLLTCGLVFLSYSGKKSTNHPETHISQNASCWYFPLNVYVWSSCMVGPHIYPVSHFFPREKINQIRGLETLYSKSFKEQAKNT